MILSDPAQKTKYDLSIRDSIDDNESTAGGEVTEPVIVETSGISWQSFGVHLLRKRYEVFTGTAARFYAWLSHPMEN